MKTIALTLFAAALGFAQSSSSPETTRATPAPQAASKTTPSTQKKKPAQPAPTAADQKSKAQSQVQAIPSGATQVEPNLYRYTDSSGKTWNYRQTPFGISKWEENSVPQAAPAKSEPVVVTDLGDSYRFEKKTPFGESTWIRKKSELTDEEIGLTQSPRAQSNPNQNRVDSKPAGNQ